MPRGPGQVGQRPPSGKNDTLFCSENIPCAHWPLPNQRSRTLIIEPGEGLTLHQSERRRPSGDLLGAETPPNMARIIPLTLCWEGRVPSSALSLPASSLWIFKRCHDAWLHCLPSHSESWLQVCYAFSDPLPRPLQTQILLSSPLGAGRGFSQSPEPPEGWEGRVSIHGKHTPFPLQSLVILFQGWRSDPKSHTQEQGRV